MNPEDEQQEPGPPKSRKRTIGQWLWRRPQRWFLFGIPAGGFLAFVIGAGFWIGFDTTVKATNSLEFCISCHEMKNFVYPEYAESVHAQNASGVSATCADCHVPTAFFPKMARKIQATLVEVPSHFMGKIDTQEKFDAHKREMAERVWAGMRANNSRECRDCHSYETMSADLQGRQAQRRHSLEYREATGKTCIDCHQGIAHSLPE